VGAGAAAWVIARSSNSENPVSAPSTEPSARSSPKFVALPCDTVLAFSASFTVETPYERVVTQYDGLATDHPTTTVSRERFAAPDAGSPSPYFFASITTPFSSR